MENCCDLPLLDQCKVVSVEVVRDENPTFPLHGLEGLQDGGVSATDGVDRGYLGVVGGTHLTLVIAGALGVSVEEAERLKKDPAEQPRLFPLVRPVMEKVASIVSTNTRGWPTPRVYLVGGTAAFPGFADVVSQASGLDAVVPVAPLFVTPLGIARVAPALEVGYRPAYG